MKNKRTIRLALALAMAFFLSSPVFAQEKKILTLNEAISLGIKNSKQLKGSEARIAQATGAFKEAVERRLPDASVSGSYLRLNKPNVSLKSNNNGSTTGGSNSGGNSATPNSAAYIMGNVSMPLFSGFRIKYGIEAARYLEQAAKLDADNDREAVVSNTIDAYNNLYKSSFAVQIYDSFLRASQERVRELSNQERNGLLPRNDLLKAQLQQSNTELALLDAQNNWQLANISMNIMLGLPDATQLVLDTTSLKTPVQFKGIEDYLQDALKSRKDLSALSYRHKAATTGVKVAQSEKYPGIALSAGYVALDVPHLLTVVNAVNVGIGVRYDIASLWKNKSKVQQAQAREQEIAAGEEQLTDAIRLQVHQRYLTLTSSRKKIDVNATAVAQATENKRVIQNKFNNQLATTTELLDADAALLQATLNYSSSQLDAVVAYYKLLQATGSLSDTTK